MASTASDPVGIIREVLMEAHEEIPCGSEGYTGWSLVLAERIAKSVGLLCSECEGVGEVVVNSFQAGDQTAEEWGPCPACIPTDSSGA